MLKFLNYDVFMSLKIIYILPNSVDPDEMQHNAAFHLRLHCLPKYLFASTVKPVLSGHSKRRPKIGFQDRL